MLNSIGRELPEEIKGYGPVKPFSGMFTHMQQLTTASTTTRGKMPGESKLQLDMLALLKAANLQNGATISFHHHLREGDLLLNMVVDAIAQLGLHDIHIAASSLFTAHAPLIEHIHSGVVTRISAAYIAGPLGKAIAQGLMAQPVVMYTHGGRARAIESGELKIDLAFIAAPTADHCGNSNGVDGRAACGPLGYAMVDARYAKKVAVVTDNLVAYPTSQADITQDLVDFVLVVDSIGDPAGIVSGTTRATTNPIGLQIAKTAAEVIVASGLLVDGFSFQTGAGGTSLAVAVELKKVMLEQNIKGSFASGGITGYIVDMLEAGLFRSLFDVQCFDLRAVASYRSNPVHCGMSSSTYANPHSRGAVVNELDVVILGAAEIDTAFNVNVTTGTSGVILGGSGGHADTAAGAKLAIVTTMLTAKGFAKVVSRVTTVTTPGESIDVLVTEAGVAVNPTRQDLLVKLRDAGINVVSIEHLQQLAQQVVGPNIHQIPEGRIVAVVEYRDGTVIDVVRAMARQPDSTALQPSSITTISGDA